MKNAQLAADEQRDAWFTKIGAIFNDPDALRSGFVRRANLRAVLLT